MAFPARFAGTCDKCHKPIEKGNQITWSSRETGKAYHFDCDNPGMSSEDVASAIAARKGESVPTPQASVPSAPSTAALDALAALTAALTPQVHAQTVDEDIRRFLAISQRTKSRFRIVGKPWESWKQK